MCLFFLILLFHFFASSCDGDAGFDSDINKYAIFNQGGVSYGDIKNGLKEFRKKIGGLTGNHQNEGGSVYDDGTELSKNVKFLEDIFESDIILNMAQVKDLLQGKIDWLQNINNNRNKRKVLSDKRGLWPTPNINYGFDSTITDKRREYIKAGIKHWEDNTCLKFRENKTGDYVLFVSGAGCYSAVGRIGGKQEVSLGDGCELLGVVAHEIGHILGFWHEHGRPDREKYIKINYQNVMFNMETNFNRLPSSYVDDYGVAYDLGSALHYSAKAYTANSLKRTIDTLDPNFITTIGQRKSLSFIDIKQINLAYCSNGCSKELTATTSWQQLNANGNPKECSWLIKAPDRSKIRFQIKSLSMACKEVCKSFVEVKYKDNFEQTGSRHCCELPPAPIVSATNELVVMYRSDLDNKQGSGFAGQYKIDDGKGDEPNSKGPQFPGTKTSDDWEEWSDCSERCGGCGVRTRKKRCVNTPTKVCTEQSTCNEQTCQKEAVCNFPVTVPCRHQDHAVGGTKVNDEVMATFQNPPDYVGGQIIIGPETEQAPTPAPTHARKKRSPKSLPVRGTKSNNGPAPTAVASNGPPKSSFQPPAKSTSQAGSPSNNWSSSSQSNSQSTSQTNSQTNVLPASQVNTQSASQSISQSGSQVKNCGRNLQYQCTIDSPHKIHDSAYSPCCKGFEKQGERCVKRSASLLYRQSAFRTLLTKDIGGN